jgi:hypothetical protein
VIAYDTNFNRKIYKINGDIPIIRLVAKDTLEHALVYEMLNQDNFSVSNLSEPQMTRILKFGLNNKYAGCELSKFDIQGTCNKVYQWIDKGMLENLTFEMEAAVEFDKLCTRNGKERKELASVKAEKRVSEVSDEGNLKKRKVSKFNNDDDDDDFCFYSNL